MDVTSILWSKFMLVIFLDIGVLSCSTYAPSFINPSLVAFIRTLDIVFGIIIQVVLFHSVPHYFGIIGAILVIFAVIAKAFEEFLMEIIEKYIFRQKKQPESCKLSEDIKNDDMKYDSLK